MTNKIEAWAVVRTDDKLMTTFKTESDALAEAIRLKARSLSELTVPPVNFRVVRLVEETQPAVEKPKVKMTQSEFNEWQQLYSRHRKNRAYFALEALETGEFSDLYAKFADYIEDLPTFANLWVDYDPEYPEKTIEVEHEKKWFVRSKGFMRGEYTYSKIDRNGVIVQQTFEKSDAMRFDTQEEAEKWVNPLNEAVLLEVEE